MVNLLKRNTIETPERLNLEISYFFNKEIVFAEWSDHFEKLVISHVILSGTICAVISSQRCKQPCQSFSVVSGLSPKAAQPQALKSVRVHVCAYVSVNRSVSLAGR